MALPTTKTKPLTKFTDYTTLLYGASKVGKSTFCSKAENALFLATEPGLNALNVYQHQIHNWLELLDACGDLVKGDHNFSTIVIDTIDNAYSYCQDYICKKNNIEHESDLGYGKGFQMVNTEFQRVLTRLAHLPYGLFLISHTTEKEVDTRTGKYMKTVPTLPNKAGKIVLGLVDIILYGTIELGKDKNGEDVEKRVIYTKPSKFYDAGDRTGCLPEKLELNYDAVIKAFNKK